jgi:hypothetical protein
MTLDALIRGSKTQPVGSAKTEGTSARPDDVALWWRVAILEPGGRTVETDTPSGWNLGEWAAYAERYHGPGCTLAPIARLPKPTATGPPR